MYGGTGTDTLDLRGFNDTMNVSLASGQTSVMGEVIQGFESVRMGNGSNTVIGTTADNQLTGGTDSDTLHGGDGSDMLVGGAGIDRMLGGTGNDIISVEAAGDQIVETVGGGTAGRVMTYVSYVLAAGVEVEFLEGGPFPGDHRDELDRQQFRPSHHRQCRGQPSGCKGGSDTITGGAGADVFVFTAALGATNIDTIADYDVAVDRIGIDNADLSGLAAGALTVAAFWQQYQWHGDYRRATGAAARVQCADLAGGLAMAASEFTVI